VRCYGFIYNPRSGDGHRRDLLLLSAERLRAQGKQVREYLADGEPGKQVDAALYDGCDVIVACGGDGTVSSVAHALHERRGASTNPAAVLGVLPLGTLNHFAKDLGIFGMADAERILLTGQVREIDAGMVNGRLFVNNSGIGIYPMMVLERERVRKAGVPKWPAFVLACIKILLNLPFLRLRLEADGVRLARHTPFLFVGNNVYTVQGKKLGRRRHLDEGLLGIYTARHVGPTGLFRIALRALLGTIRQDRDFTALTAKHLLVSGRPKRPLHVSLDGEVCRMKAPLEYSVLPQALRVLAP
jgi:diacylglycerol kinase family enzyme